MEKRKKYKVTNKAKDVRKFREQDSGKDIFVQPKKSVLTDCPPDKTNDIWNVRSNKKEEEPKIEEKLEEPEEEEENKLNNTGG